MNAIRIARLKYSVLLVAVCVWVLILTPGCSPSGEALVDAARMGDVAKVQDLLDMGVDVNHQDKNGETALMKASSEGHEVVVKVLLAEGAKVNDTTNDGQTALSLANTKAVASLLKAAGAQHTHVASVGNNKALRGAAFLGDDALVADLLAKGANVNQPNAGSETALMTASWMGHQKVVQLLLAQGADVNLRNKKGQTALDVAKNKEVIQLLKATGAK
jgi:hypothetical protein